MLKKIFFSLGIISSLLFVPNESLLGIDTVGVVTNMEQNSLIELESPELGLHHTRNHGNIRRCCLQKGQKGATGATGASSPINNAYTQSVEGQFFVSNQTIFPSKFVFSGAIPPFTATGITYDSTTNDFILPSTGKYLINVQFTGFFIDPMSGISLDGSANFEFLINNIPFVGNSFQSPTTTFLKPNVLTVFSLGATILVTVTAGDRVSLAVASVANLDEPQPITLGINAPVLITFVQIE